MNDYQSLSHTKWECKYPVVFIPKYRRKALYTELRRHLVEVVLQRHRHPPPVHLAGDPAVEAITDLSAPNAV